MTDDIQIRPVQDNDSDAVIALIDLCWSAYPGVILNVDLEEPGLRHPATHFSERDGQMWTAWDGKSLGGVVGYTLGAAGADAELLKLYVHPDQRRSGLGRRLTMLVEQTVRERGARTLELWSDTRFETAHRFYRSLGYSQTGEKRALNDISNSFEYRFLKTLER